MMGIKDRAFKTHPALCLEALVPADNFYRQLEAILDLGFVRHLVAEFYTPFGRPSVDPVVFFKLQLIMLFEDIRSERQLMEKVHLNLALRWYIGYDLDEAVPDHSTLTKIRERYGLSVFRHFFEKIVELCIAAGLVWGKELYFDGTRVAANADMASNVPNFHYQLIQHLKGLFPDEAPSDFMEHWIEGYREPNAWKKAPSAYESFADKHTSLTDPDATPLRPNSFASARLGYHTHYAVDGGRNRIILGVLVTPASIQDNQPLMDFVRWLRFRWHIFPDTVVGDSKYGTVENIVALLQDGIQPFIPRTDYNKGKKFYANDLFRYDADQDVYYCPQNQILKRQGIYNTNQSIAYRASAKVCRPCPVRNECTTSQRGRTLHRSFFQTALDASAALRTTEPYKKAMRKRQVWVEPLFGEAKQWHRLARFRLRRLRRVNIEALLIASVQNIKRLLKPRYCHTNHPAPVSPMALISAIEIYLTPVLIATILGSRDFFNRLRPSVKHLTVRFRTFAINLP